MSIFTKRPARVLIVGSGASGIAAAYALGKCPDRFDVHVWEKSALPGGVASSVRIEGPGNLFINDGVQGGTRSYRNVLNLMTEFGFVGSPVYLKISFGKGPTAWSNYKKTQLTDTHKDEIKKFDRTLRIINKFECVFVFVPISKVMQWFGHSDEFCNQMVLPLVALFFATGNQTPNVSSAVIARVFLDDKLRMFDYDPERLLSQMPEMFIFPNLCEMYQTIVKKIACTFHGERTVEFVNREQGKVFVTDDKGCQEEFDEIIFSCTAETVLAVLRNPTFMERKVLGNIEYYNDVTITHEDEEYMAKHYELNTNVDQYFIRSDPDDPTKLEMSFNLSNYQPQLKGCGRNIYQTIFLNDAAKSAWTINEINTNKIRLEKWWRKFSHSWRHFAFTVPFMRYIQGTKHTWYCGTYTLIGTHEVAVISGLTAAYRLGAKYPFPQDDLAKMQFEDHLLLCHGKTARFGCNKDTVVSICMAPLMRIFLVTALCLQFFVRCFRKD
ncbi:unnamed protein product [Candidula unifasciata]|uniref:Uncharacterized protein n=1 Tax=Candidula unifasciata TaxID=100452 RepID=A0A8S3YTF6_9EUPU|nr:unnamed protein product [Candidula unifasciata]